MAAAADLALLGGLEEEEEPKGPTMMGREARQLMLSGQGAAGLAAWKVHPVSSAIPSASLASLVLSGTSIIPSAMLSAVRECFAGPPSGVAMAAVPERAVGTSAASAGYCAGAIL